MYHTGILDDLCTLVWHVTTDDLHLDVLWTTPQKTSPHTHRLRKVRRHTNCTTIYTWDGSAGCCIQQRCLVGCNINRCRFNTQIPCFQTSHE